jgi:hypothetical protein
VALLATLAGGMAWSGMAEGPRGALIRFWSMPPLADGALKKYYVPFKFLYPNYWERMSDPDAPDAADYVRVRDMSGEWPLAAMAVGYFSANFDEERTCSELLNAFATQDHDLGEHVLHVREGRCKFGRYQGYEICLEGVQETETHGRITQWLRGVIVHDKGTSGVFVVMLASSLNPEIKQASDLGAVGALKAAEDSFQFLD